MKTNMMLSAAAISLAGLLSGCVSAPTEALPNPIATKAEASPPLPTAVHALKPSDVLRDVFLLKAFDSDGKEISQGSGFIANKAIITNAHVIADAAWVNIYNSGNELVSTSAYASYLSIEDDLAVLPYPGAPYTGLNVRRDRPDIGDTIWAYGAPMGLQNTVTIGNVSAFRDIEGRERMQISAPVSSGSSGGPVVDTDGNVVGVVVSVYREGQNLNFAIPAASIPETSEFSRTPIPFPKGSDFPSEDPELSASQALLVLAVMTSSEVSYGQPVTHWFTEDDKMGDFYIKFYAFKGATGVVAH